MTVIIEKNIPVPMRDGVVLRADIYRPSAGGRHPVLIQRTPYNKELLPLVSLTMDPLRAAAAGYVVVIQDVRSRWASEGAPFVLYAKEDEDGFDTAAWAAGQAWSDGNTAAYGLSYMGGTTWMTAITTPPSLRAISPTTAPCEFWNNHFWRGGALQLGLLARWALAVIGPSALLRAKGLTPAGAAALTRLVASIDDFEGVVRQAPIAAFPAAMPEEPDFLPFVFETLKHPTCDDWAQSKLIKAGDHKNVKVPALIIAGWHDLLLAGDLMHFERMRKEAGSEEARRSTRMIIGPWSHGMFLNVVGDLDFGLRASGFFLDMREDLTTLQLRWFDRWLKNDNKGIDGQAPVRIFVQGLNRWRDEQEWPLARARDTALYLGAEGKLSFDAPASAQAPDTYTYDPADPCLTCGGALLMPGTYRPGPIDQTPWLQRSDVLCYTSAPLDAPMEVTGPVKAVIYAATSAPDTDWVVKLCDVHPDGRTYNVCDGILRARFRESLSDTRLVQPGEVLSYEIDLCATSIVFGAGHRLRLLVTSSDFPRYERNPNTGEFGVTATGMQVARQSIHHDPKHPSHVVLPVVPASK
ncbi:MAG: CocE/NonD family hydrolase [Panacagrimonas sp.]